MAIRRTTITVTGATGGAGVATANAASSTILIGDIRAVYLEYTDSPPAATCDVAIVENTNSPAMPILTITNAATDGWFYPLAQADNQAGTDITNQGTLIPVMDYVKVTIAQANNDDGVIATIVWDDGR
jgi:hypothetical protein